MDAYPEIFDALPTPFLFLSAEDDFVILAVNEAYLAVSGRTRSIVGQPLLSVFPDNTDAGVAGGSILTQSLHNVVRERKPQELPLLRFDVQGHAGSPFAERYWRVENTPVTDAAGNLLGILHGVTEVTTQVLLRRQLARQENQNQERIRNAVLTTQEVERMEISQELHDNVGQILHTTRLYLEKAQADPATAASFVRLGHDLVVKAIDEVKELSQTLLHATDDEKHLNVLLEELLTNVIELKQVEVSRSFELPPETLIESKVKTTVLRVLQEQLTNVIRHSEARRLSVRLHFQDGHLRLTVQDDGKGFDTASVVQGSGLRNMKSRIAMVGGTLDINSRPGDGCTIHVTIPGRNLS